LGGHENVKVIPLCEKVKGVIANPMSRFLSPSTMCSKPYSTHLLIIVVELEESVVASHGPAGIIKI
jgi:hypothetical protein